MIKSTPNGPDERAPRTLKERAWFLMCLTIVAGGLVLAHLFYPRGWDFALFGLLIIAALASEVAGRWPSR